MLSSVVSDTFGKSSSAILSHLLKHPDDKDFDFLPLLHGSMLKKQGNCQKTLHILMVKLTRRVIMYLYYDEAVQVGLKAYQTLEYAGSCRSAFRVATREFKGYLEDTDLPYSSELAQQWINDNKEHWSNYKLQSSKKSMSVLKDIMEHGFVTTSLQTKIERTPPYTLLPNWSRTILDNYLSTLTCAYGALYLTQIRNACSRFFLFLELIE